MLTLPAYKLVDTLFSEINDLAAIIEMTNVLMAACILFSKQHVEKSDLHKWNKQAT